MISSGNCREVDGFFIGSLLVVTGMRVYVCACVCVRVCVCVRSCVREMYWTLGGNAYSLLAIDLWGYRTVPTYKNKFFVFPSPFRLVCEKLVLNSISEKWNSENFEFHFFSSESPEIETQEIG